MQSENSTAHIVCENYSSIYFSHSSYIEITNLEFIGCGKNQVVCVVEFIVQDTTFKGQEYSGTALNFIETMAQIVNSTFVSNRRGSYRKCVLYDPDDGCYSDGFIGGAIIATNSTVDINQSEFEDNGADYGGGIFAEQKSIIMMSNNAFIDNHNITSYGGVLYSNSSSITIEASGFYGNDAIYWGGAIFADHSSINMNHNVFCDNTATHQGGVLGSISSNITLTEANEFYHNSAFRGGGIFATNSTIEISLSKFENNSAEYDGGALYAYHSSINMSHNQRRLVTDFN